MTTNDISAESTNILFTRHCHHYCWTETSCKGRRQVARLWRKISCLGHRSNPFPLSLPQKKTMKLQQSFLDDHQYPKESIVVNADTCRGEAGEAGKGMALYPENPSAQSLPTVRDGVGGVRWPAPNLLERGSAGREEKGRDETRKIEGKRWSMKIGKFGVEREITNR